MAVNQFLMNFLARSAEKSSTPTMVLGPDKDGEDMEKAPKKGGKKVKAPPSLPNEIHERIRDERWNRKEITDYLKTLI